MKTKIFALISFVMIGFAASAHNQSEVQVMEQEQAVEQGPIVVSVDCIYQMDGKVAIINPKCLPASREQILATRSIAPQIGNCSRCQWLTNIAEKNACYSSCHGGR